MKARDKHDRIIVTEKLDGSNVAVAKVNGEIMALGRAGFLASSSPYEQHHFFAAWVDRNRDIFSSLLKNGERVNGEWLALAHGTRYQLPHEPFVAFDMMVGAVRLPWDETANRCREHDIVLPRVLSDGPPFNMDQMLSVLDDSPHGPLDPVEGAVWRVERKGAFDFMAKWVRPDKQDGKYLTDITGHEPIWHWRP